MERFLEVISLCYYEGLVTSVWARYGARVINFHWENTKTGARNLLDGFNKDAPFLWIWAHVQSPSKSLVISSLVQMAYQKTCPAWKNMAYNVTRSSKIIMKTMFVIKFEASSWNCLPISYLPGYNFNQRCTASTFELQYMFTFIRSISHDLLWKKKQLSNSYLEKILT